MALDSLSLRNIDAVPPCDSSRFWIGLLHWQDGLLYDPAVEDTESLSCYCQRIVKAHLSFDGSLGEMTTTE